MKSTADKSKCKGKIYKADVTVCRTQKGFGKFVRMNEMKRLSCGGCKHCEYINAMLSNISDDYDLVCGMHIVEDGELYELCASSNSPSSAYNYDGDFDDDSRLEVKKHCSDKKKDLSENASK